MTTPAASSSYPASFHHGKKWNLKSKGVRLAPNRCLVRATSHMSRKLPSQPSAVDSTKQTLPACNVFSDPVMTSLALSGYWEHNEPNSDTCRSCRVPLRIEVATRIELLLLNSSSSAESLMIGRALFS